MTGHPNITIFGFQILNRNTVRQSFCTSVRRSDAMIQTPRRVSRHPQDPFHFRAKDGAYGSCLPPICIRQDFEDGCFQPRARRASQSFGRAALAESLAHCRVMGLSHKGDLHALDGQQRWIFWPSGTSHVWPHRSQVQRVTDTVFVILSLMIEPRGHRISPFLSE